MLRMLDLIGDLRLRMLTYASYNADVCCRMLLQVLRMLDLIGDLRLRVRVPNLLALYQVNPIFTCFISTKVQIMTLMRLPGHLELDLEHAQRAAQSQLLAQKYK